MSDFNWEDYEVKGSKIPSVLPEEQFDFSQYENQESPHKEQGFLGNLLDYEKGLGLGTAQTAGDIGASIGNFGIEGLSNLFGKEIPRIPHPNLKQYYPESEWGQTGSDIGNFAGNFAVPGVGYLKALKLANSLPGKIAAGAGAGALGGAAINEEDRGGGAVAGGITGGLLPALHRLLPSSVANNITKAYHKAKDVGSGMYNRVWKDAAEEGLTHAPLSKGIPHKNFEEEAGSDYVTRLKEYIKDPTLENAHWAQSDLGKFIDSFKGVKPHEIPSPKLRALDEAKTLQEKIKESMFSHNALGTRPHLAKAYSKASENWAKNVIPYQDIKNIREYAKGKVKSSTLIKNALKNENFMLNKAEKHPALLAHEAAQNPLLRKILGAVGAGAGLGTGAYGTYKLFK